MLDKRPVSVELIGWRVGALFIACAVIVGVAVLWYERSRGIGWAEAVLSGASGAMVGAFVPILIGFIIFVLFLVAENLLMLVTLPALLCARLHSHACAVRVIELQERVGMILGGAIAKGLFPLVKVFFKENPADD